MQEADGLSTASSSYAPAFWMPEAVSTLAVAVPYCAEWESEKKGREMPQISKLNVNTGGAGVANGRAPDKPLQSVVDQVAATILGMILANELEPGTVVAIQDLSKRLGTSHVPIREALRRLEARGLVIFRRGRRPQIAPINTQDFDNIFHLRTLIEKDVAERSAPAMNAAQLRKLEATMAEFEWIFTQGSAFDVYEVHARFHLELLPGASDWDRRILDQLLAASERYIQLYVGARPEPDVVRTILALHWDLVEAARSVARLPAAIVGHVQDSVRLIRPTVTVVSDAAAQRDAASESGIGFANRVT